MVLFGRSSFCGALFTLALSMFATQAQAQKAEFTLPFETHWVNAVLPPGTYQVTGFGGESWPKVLSITGNNQKFFVLATRETPISGEDDSYLKIVDVHGAQVVQEFNSPMSGKRFLFVPAKSLQVQAAAQSGSETATKIATRVVH